MKKFIIFVFALHFLTASSQEPTLNKYQCSCNKIGLSSSWADSNRITCFSIPVDRNSSKPAAEKFHLAVVVVASKNNTKELPLLYLHGGPGIATVANVPSFLKSKAWMQLGQQHSLVFFDYRGTGFSEPDLCHDIEDSILNFSSGNSSSLERSQYAVALYKNCREKLSQQGIHLSDFNSYQLADDAEQIRKVLQIPEWNVYGVSYGTTIALNLLRSFPAPIRSVVLDSPFPPNAPWSDFVRPFDTCFKVLEKKVAENINTKDVFPFLKSEFANAVERLNKKPVLLSQNKNGVDKKRWYSGDDFAWSIWTALLKPKAIPMVPLVIHQVAMGNDSLLSQWSTLFSAPNSFGKFSETQSRAILCYEGRPRRQEDTEEALKANYPEFTSFNAGLPVDICNVWRPEVADEKIFHPVVSNKPVLILSGEYDPVCPPFFAEITKATLPNAFLVNVPSASHAVLDFNDCTRDIVSYWLQHPSKNIPVECIKRNEPVQFITDDIYEAFQNYNRNK
jgi:pimeloyl-ACP methyl ester carboxylesterase